MIHAWRFARTESGNELEACERERESLTGDQVLVEVHAAVFGAPELAAMDAAPRSDRTPGGAGVGVVVDGAEAASELVGARVLIPPTVPCGECEMCERGAIFGCAEGYVLGGDRHGTLASHVCARGRWVCPIGGELDPPGPAAALLAREAASAFALYARTGVSPGEPVVIVGDDAVAGFLEQVARARGTNPIRATSPGQATDAAGNAGFDQRPWRVFETSGTAPARQLAADLAGPGSSLSLLATPGGAARIDMSELRQRGVQVVLVAGAHPDLLTEVAAMAVRGELDPTTACELTPFEQPETIPNRARVAVASGKALVVRMR